MNSQIDAAIARLKAAKVAFGEATQFALSELPHGFGRVLEGARDGILTASPDGSVLAHPVVATARAAMDAAREELEHLLQGERDR